MLSLLLKNCSSFPSSPKASIKNDSSMCTFSELGRDRKKAALNNLNLFTFLQWLQWDLTFSLCIWESVYTKLTWYMLGLYPVSALNVLITDHLSARYYHWFLWWVMWVSCCQLKKKKNNNNTFLLTWIQVDGSKISSGIFLACSTMNSSWDACKI